MTSHANKKRHREAKDKVGTYTMTDAEWVDEMSPTKIVKTQEEMINGIRVVFELWLQDHIWGCSAVTAKADTGHMTEEELVAFLWSDIDPPKDITFGESETQRFVNYGFYAE